MKKKYIGDTKDIFKRGILSLLLTKSDRKKLYAVALSTDSRNRTLQWKSSYLKLLGQGGNIPFFSQTFPSDWDEQEKYFAEIKKRAAAGNRIFLLDPDTGLRIDKKLGKSRQNYAYLDLIFGLIGDKNLAIVYDESLSIGRLAARKRRAKSKLKAVARRNSVGFAFVGRSGMPSVVVFGKQSMLETVKRMLGKLIDAGVPTTHIAWSSDEIVDLSESKLAA